MPEMWENQTWVLLHENASAHTLLLSYPAWHQKYVVPHPPYSLDLATANFFLFLKLETTLKGGCSQAIEVQENARRKPSPITENAFRKSASN